METYNKNTLERLILEENKSYTYIGKLYGVSGNAIKKAAKKMGMALFGESFPNWSQTLHAAFDREKGFDFEKKIQKIIAEKKDSMR